mmetsp:Transcript_172022/g.551404  ORF Transcript_172022/g.551404 Transcript_172022/m.551404 type:complete len:253 (-) Transcript_172022:190-948(-)
MLGGLDLDNVAVQERATHDDLLRGGQAIGPLRAHVTALDGYLVTLDDPEFPVAVEARACAIERDDVGIAPEGASLRPNWSCARGRGRNMATLHNSCARRSRPQDDGKHYHHKQHYEGADERHVVLLCVRDGREVAGTCANILVCRLSDPITGSASDIGQLTCGSRSAAHATHLAHSVGAADAADPDAAAPDAAAAGAASRPTTELAGTAHTCDSASRASDGACIAQTQAQVALAASVQVRTTAHASTRHRHA